MWTYQQLFNDLNTADLNGQDSWNGSALFDVTTDSPYEGTKCVKCSHNADSSVVIDRAISAISSGVFYVSIKLNRTAGVRRGSIYLLSGSTEVARVFIFNTGTTKKLQMLINDGDFWLDLVSDITNDTWYRVGFEFDDASQNNKYRCNVNGGAWSNWYTYYGAPSWTTIDKIRLADEGNNGSGSGTISFDTISPDYTPAPPLDYQISGTVTLSGAPVEGAVVRCIRQSDNVAITEETTSETGAYLFTELEETELYHVCVEYSDGETSYNAKSLWDIVPIEVEL